MRRDCVSSRGVAFDALRDLQLRQPALAAFTHDDRLVTYFSVVFSILVQGLTVKPILQWVIGSRR
jgi:hypothetical protein